MQTMAITSLWSHRGFVFSSVKREFQARYKNSLAGFLWAVLNPLAQIVVYTVIFSQIMRAKLPGVESQYGYGLYVCTGIICWGFFSEILTRSQSMFLDNANLMKKISFPHLCIPAIVVGSAVLNFSIVFGLFSLFLLMTGVFPGGVYLALLPIILVLVLLASGLGVILGVLNVFFRDVGQFFGILITFWFWLTPIVYPKVILPEYAIPLVDLNPMTHILAAVQGVVLYGAWPQMKDMAYPVVMAGVLCLLGWNLYRRHSADIVDEL